MLFRILTILSILLSAVNAQAAAPVAEGAFSTPYSLQTGPIKFAPMQQRAPTSITANGISPQYPTSSYDVATTNLPIAIVISTQTQPLTYKTTSRENSVSFGWIPSNED